VQQRISQLKDSYVADFISAEEEICRHIRSGVKNIFSDRAAINVCGGTVWHACCCVWG